MRAHDSFLETVFYKSKLSLGFVNLKPILPGHILVIPRRVASRLADLTTEEVADLFSSCQCIGKVLERHYKGESLTVALQDGFAAGQSVPHVHVHVIPRRTGDLRNNDDIYGELEQQKLDNIDRAPRSEIEMSEEAELLRSYFKDVAVDE